MNSIIKSALLGSALGCALVAAPQVALAAKKTEAPAAVANPLAAIGVANPEAIVVASTAFQQAERQRPTVYKATIDAAQSRKTQIETQLKPLYEKLEKDSKAPKADRNLLQQQMIQIRQIEQSGEQELQKMLAPLDQSRQFVLEQIEDKLGTAMQQAMAKRGVSMVVRRESVLRYDPANDLNQAVVAELNTLLPSAQITPPQGWLPRAEREAAAQAAQAQGKAPAASPAQQTGQQPEGR